MKKNITCLLLVTIIISIFCLTVSFSQTINVKDYIKDKFPSIFSFYLSSLEELDSYKKEFIDLLQKLPKDKQGYYAKEVYKNGFSLELLKNIREGKTIQAPASRPALPSTPQQKEESTENLPTLIKRIKPSTVIIFAYDDKGEFLQLGSGFFISQNGDVITNYHVIQGASSAEIKTADENTYPITYIVAGDEQNDIIRLSVNIPSQYVYPLSLSKTIPEVGERIIVYGSPLGLENTVSDGIVSAIRDVPDYGRIIQITAPISPGSSGSPVLNMQGEVIGIATFQMIDGQNLNFAIPSERIISLISTEENKISIDEEMFEQESKTTKVSEYEEAYQKALYFMVKEEYEKALPYLEIAMKTDVLSLKELAYYYIGCCNRELGNYNKAIEAYIKAIAIDPNDADAWNDLGVAYRDLGQYENALETFKQAVRIDPDYEFFHFNLGLTFGNLGLYKDAVESFKQAIRINPNSTDYYYSIGNTYFNIGIDYAEQGIQKKFYEVMKQAAESYKQAIRIDPNNVDAHYALGGISFFVGDKNSALNEYKILKELDIDLANDLFDTIYK